LVLFFKKELLSSMPSDPSWQFWIDRGGTFTDIVARNPAGQLITLKLLSENPGHYADAAIEGISRMLGQPMRPGLIGAVKIGTTVATNALLERRGAPTLLLVNQGFADMLLIGTQARPRLFDLHIVRPDPLYRRVCEISGRIDAAGNEIEPLDEAAASTALHEAAAQGLRACAIALMHAWTFPAHEQRLAALARAAGFTQISASHQVSPLLRLVPRAETTVADAYLSPVLRRYVDRLSDSLRGTKLFFMQSNGGLVQAAAFAGKDAVLSGPAGGIVGAARTAAAAGFDRIISFDMGGTSTDVALYAGAFERNSETEIAGVRLRAPMLAIHTVAAGGGSVLHFDGARSRVGPDSAGASPGPAAYRNGGPLTITDANICVGKIQPAYFPALFGPRGDAPLDAEIVRDRFAALAQDIAVSTRRPADPRAVADGFLRIAAARMAAAIKQVSIQKGHDASRFVLNCFGGAGGQHACLVADELGMETILIHPLAGVLSAYGMGLADNSVIREQAVERRLEASLFPAIEALADQLADAGRNALIAHGAHPAALRTRRLLVLRTEGTEAALTVPLENLQSATEAFAAAHRARFGFPPPDRPITVDSVSVEVLQPGENVAEAAWPSRETGTATPIAHVEVWTDGAVHDTPVFDRADLRAGDAITGPALVCEALATTVIEPGWQADVTARNHMILRRTSKRALRHAPDTGLPDPSLLELFNNLFMSIAEQSGAVLANTALSVNIKERLDFSCAIFDATGALVANAPHVPVHLGAMGASVTSILRARGTSLRPGDVLALNNPANGGTHLPDITVITPVFDASGAALRFVVACRGHHTDIGGLTPGSTPPFSRTLEEEGVVIDDFLLADASGFREAEFRALLARARYPARNPDMNVADIKAQIAANARSVAELNAAVARHGWPMVAAYMRHVMNNAEESVRRVIDRLPDGKFDYDMDDGARLSVAIRVDRPNRAATIDFSGTGACRDGNFNAPEAITRAVVLYVFRCLVGEDIPLNDGCLKPLTLIIPQGSFLSPPPEAAVVAGNTEVSQALCSALLGALSAAACSQATMNNFLFGNAHLQYYETIGGGSGAGPGFPGASAVQCHMTNTRMTDPELLELRYPVRLEDFAIRRGSGGDGQWPGGDGARRRIRFLQPMTATIVASRRSIPPFGLAGGAPGATGEQWVDHTDSSRTVLGPRATIPLAAGDAVTILTPGGGGYGPPRSKTPKGDST
jgi:5-oxoprolinase (ATP-hydrolysing)